MLGAENEKADAAINRIYDDTWNDVDRPGNDRYLALMYPRGAAYYTDGDTPGQPARMELRAKLYDRALHPWLTCGDIDRRSRLGAGHLQSRWVASAVGDRDFAEMTGGKRSAGTCSDGADARRSR